ncbi:fatty acid desaturase [Phaeobacter sp. QD34_3]|uniref:fatty acid desaturase n=1 Tax=unclassified Phaeobacter TaxID=2621772 RepID=UPI00237F202E|nr:MULTISPECIES: fatty acid desaturase [unclassified Phaeobacter]MDE4133817.1 fatty acid desaturase [Phaeobacter sp. QD34_3]MDE4137491.1 fatty acid desaturase [Phaeobacter sp. QD34_24]
MSEMPKVPAECMPRGVEWGTLALILACYGAWLAGIVWLPVIGIWLAIMVSGLLIALHSSLCHEALHGHPFRIRALNEALMALPLNLVIPYGRFRDTHLAHHRDERLTDPFDDPESNYLCPKVWGGLPKWQQLLLRANNTLLGRMLLGPLISQVCFMHGDWRMIRAGERQVIVDWLLHVAGVVVVIWLVWRSPMPLWAYALAVYLGLALLKIRTFLEHRAHEDPHARTVLVEDRGPLAFLFLNNNLHIVHHMHPGVPWHALPRLYRLHKPAYKEANEAYVYRSYLQVFWHYLLRTKDPVPHPLWQKNG